MLRLLIRTIGDSQIKAIFDAIATKTEKTKKVLEFFINDKQDMDKVLSKNPTVKSFVNEKILDLFIDNCISFIGYGNGQIYNEVYTKVLKGLSNENKQKLFQIITYKENKLDQEELNQNILTISIIFTEEALIKIISSLPQEEKIQFFNSLYENKDEFRSIIIGTQESYLQYFNKMEEILNENFANLLPQIKKAP